MTEDIFDYSAQSVFRKGCQASDNIKLLNDILDIHSEKNEMHIGGFFQYRRCLLYGDVSTLR